MSIEEIGTENLPRDIRLLHQSVEQAISDIITRPPAEWAGWFIYTLERLDIVNRSSGNGVAPALIEARLTNILETIEDAIMKRLAEGIW